MTDTGRPSPPIQIQTAGAAAAKLIARLSEFGSVEPWSPHAVARILDLPGCWGQLAVRPNGEPVGFLIARVIADEAEILNLVVAAGARRKGIGCELLSVALAKACQSGASVIFLEVAADNSAGCALYQSAGFREVGVRPDYYRRPQGNYVDALIMKRAI